jgi:aspartate aminotransferase-like enzyme
MSNPLVHHRGPEFAEMFREVTEGLQYFFQTQQDVLIFTSSGSGGMEASVVNLLRKEDHVVTVAGGKFGQRWTEICRAYGVDTHEIAVPWGEAPDPQILADYLRSHPNVAAVFATHSETSTGVAADVEEMARVVRENSDAIFVVDSVTSVGVLPFYMDRWGIDVAITGSQKGLMIPPGLAVAAVSERGWARCERADLPRYYFDFRKARDAAAKNTTAWTPAITLFLGLQESLRLIRARGLESLWEKYAVLAEATRQGVTALGLELFAKTPSNALTAVRIPEPLQGPKFTNHLREKYRITVAGGQGPLKGKIFRIAHLGYYDTLDMMAMMSALEMTLADLGWEFEAGAGIRAVQKVFMKR